MMMLNHQLFGLFMDKMGGWWLIMLRPKLDRYTQQQQQQQGICFKIL